MVLSSSLMDSRQDPDPLPIIQLDLDVPVVDKQFLKFELLTYHGSSGCLEYFDIVRDQTPRLKSDLKRECTRKTRGNCQPLPQFCPAPACVSPTVTWADTSTPGLVRQGCTFSAGDVFFSDPSEATCVAKKAVPARASKIDVVDGVFMVDTTKGPNLLPCTNWNETDSCNREYLEVKKKTDAVSDLSTFHFKLSSENCPDKSSASLEVVGISPDFNLTGLYLTYESLPGHLLEVTDKEKCFKLKHNLCGPNSLSFFTDKNELAVTNCQGTLLIQTELDNCGSVKLRQTFVKCFVFVFRSILNQCWRIKNFLETEEEFKFLLHEEDGWKWLGHTDKEISDFVENVTKARGFYEDETFLTPATISIECLGNEKWRFLDNNILG